MFADEDIAAVFAEESLPRGIVLDMGIVAHQSFRPDFIRRKGRQEKRGPNKHTASVLMRFVAMLKTGEQTAVIATATGLTEQTVRCYRRAMGMVLIPCGCGRAVTHKGMCWYRRRSSGRA